MVGGKGNWWDEGKVRGSIERMGQWDDGEAVRLIRWDGERSRSESRGV